MLLQYIDTHVGTYATVCIQYTQSVFVCVRYISEKEFKPAPLPLRLIYIYIPEG